MSDLLDELIEYARTYGNFVEGEAKRGCPARLELDQTPYTLALACGVIVEQQAQIEQLAEAVARLTARATDEVVRRRREEES